MQFKTTETRLNKEAKIEAKAIEAGGDDFGFISGYAAVFNVPDFEGDVIRPGSFKRSIMNRVASGKVALMVKHFRDGGDTTEAIGTIVEAEEDEFGLFINVKLMSKRLAQDTRNDVDQSPALYGMSVGWMNVAGGFRPLPEGTGREFNEMALREVTLTLLPTQDLTVGTVNAKSAVEEITDRLSVLESAIEELNGRTSDDSTSDDEAKALADSEETAVQDLAESNESIIARNNRIILLARKTDEYS